MRTLKKEEGGRGERRNKTAPKPTGSGNSVKCGLWEKVKSDGKYRMLDVIGLPEPLQLKPRPTSSPTDNTAKPKGTLASKWVRLKSTKSY